MMLVSPMELKTHELNFTLRKNENNLQFIHISIAEACQFTQA